MADRLSQIKANVGKMIDGGASEPEIEAYLGHEGVTADQLRAPQPSNQPKALDVASTAIGGLIEGVPVVGPLIRGGLERAAAATDAAFSDRTYEQNMAFIRGDRERTKREHPVIDTAAQITGAVAGTAPLVAAAPAAFGAGTAPLAARMAASTATGAALGGADAAVRSGGDLREAGVGAATGAAFGAAAPVVAAGAGKVAGAVAERVRPGQQAPSIKALREASDAAYKAMDDAGVLVHRGSFGNAIDDIVKVAKDAGVDEGLHKGATAAVNRLLTEKGADISLSKIDQLRQIIRDGATTPGDGRIVGKMVDKLDEFVNSIGMRDIKAGNLDDGVRQLTEGRELWSRVRKAELIEQALMKAERRAASTGSGGNFENAIRQNIRQILDNPNKARAFSEAEKEAMEGVVRGSTGQNFARRVGKLSPEGNGLNLLLSIGATAMDPTLATVPTVGFVGKRVADAAASRQSELLDALVRNGGPLSPSAWLAPARQGARLTTNALMNVAPPVANQQRLGR
jgi:hypothetical protein